MHCTTQLCTPQTGVYEYVYAYAYACICVYVSTVHATDMYGDLAVGEPARGAGRLYLYDSCIYILYLPQLHLYIVLCGSILYCTETWQPASPSTQARTASTAEVTSPKLMASKAAFTSGVVELTYTDVDSGRGSADLEGGVRVRGRGARLGVPPRTVHTSYETDT